MEKTPCTETVQPGCDRNTKGMKKKKKKKKMMIKKLGRDEADVMAVEAAFFSGLDEQCCSVRQRPSFTVTHRVGGVAMVTFPGNFTQDCSDKTSSCRVQSRFILT